MKLENIISIFAFLLSAYAVYKTIKFNQFQRDIDHIQNELNKLLLRKETNEALDSARADLAASFSTFGKSTTKLKIFNKGKSVARNVRIEFPDETNLFTKQEIDSKFPLERLEQFQPVELSAYRGWDSPSKVVIKLTWDDDIQMNNEKILYPTL